MAALERGFADALAASNPDFQTVHGYPADKDTKVNLTIASKWVGHTFGGLALTIEMPFKDNADLPDPARGWSGARSRRLGADTLTALHALLPSL
jgi:murein tripeptide amidase MpaA